MNKVLLFLIFLLLSIESFSQKPADTLSLYFSNNSHTPTLKHIAIIDSITSLKLAYFRNIDVIGYTNNLGSERDNLILSQKRANHIANKIHFDNRGSINWKGELPSPSIKNRRVDLVINYEEITEAPKILEIKDVLDEPDKIIPEKEGITQIAVIKKSESKFLDDKLSETKQGDKVVLPNVTFIGGRDTFLEKSYYDLYKVLRFLKNNPSTQINIQGHICCGSKKNPKEDGINKRTGKRNLSFARAKRVYTFLRKNGIKKSRMTFEGLANEFPTGKKDYFLDRRVEIEIVSK